MAGQLVFCLVSFYLLKFYTDVVGISAAISGTIILVVRWIDAFDGPLWGLVLDKTKSRWGCCRPWFLWLALPFTVFGVLTFSTPDADMTIKTVYAGLTLIIFSLLYSGINTPVTAILPTLTTIPQERVKLTCFRMLGSKIGVLLVNATALPLIGILGNGNNEKGFLLTMSCFALASLLLFLFSFRNLEEVVAIPRQSISLRDSFAVMLNNGPWLIVFISSLFFWVAFMARISMVPYFFEYRMNRPDLIPLANSLDFVSLLSIMFLPVLCKKLNKTTTWMIGLIGAALAQVIIFSGLSMNSIGFVLSGWIIGILFSGVAMALPFSLLSDCIDYGEWKSGLRAAGFLSAVGSGCCLNLGAGLGAALPAWVMQLTGYQANSEQSSAALSGICVGFVLLPAIFYALAAIPVIFYRKYELKEAVVQQELKRHRIANLDS